MRVNGAMSAIIPKEVSFLGFIADMNIENKGESDIE
jgi:hypothetical protein